LLVEPGDRLGDLVGPVAAGFALDLAEAFCSRDHHLGIDAVLHQPNELVLGRLLGIGGVSALGILRPKPFIENLLGLGARRDSDRPYTVLGPFLVQGPRSKVSID
jgi:hypothetical protein